jgi:type VI secretion system secreted protein Hcp
MKNALRRGSQLVIVILVFTFATAFVPIAAFAQNVFVLVPGITGGSTDQAHVGWIDVLSITQGWDSGKKSACQISLTKLIDVSGPRLWLAAVTGQMFGEIRIEAVKGGEIPFKFYEIRLQNARISSISTSGQKGDGIFVESLTLNSTNLILSFFTQNPDGTPGTPVTTNIPCI